MKKYISMSISDAIKADHETYVEIIGFITKPRSYTNKKQNAQWYADLLSGDSFVPISVMMRDRERCTLIDNADAHVIVRGRVSRKTGVPLILCNEIIPVQKSETPTRTKAQQQPANIVSARFTEAEMLFLRTQVIPHDMYMLDHVQVGGREIDFVLFRKSDNTPVYAFEIDGNTHSLTRVADKARDRELEAILGCRIERIPAANVYEDARKAGIIS